MSEIDKLKVALQADIKDLSKKFDEAQKIGDKTENKLNDNAKGITAGFKSAFDKIGGLKTVIAGLGVVGLVAGITSELKEMVAEADNIAKSAKAIGISSDALQEYGYAATQSGGSVESMTKSIGLLQTRLGEIASNNSGTIQLFSDLGINAKNADGSVKNLDDAMSALADRSAQLKTDQERLNLAVKVFGEEDGRKMALVLKNGADGIKNYRKEARDLGIVLDKDMLKQAEAASDAFDRFDRLISAKFKIGLASLLPVAMNVVSALSDMAKWAGRVIEPFREMEKVTKKVDATEHTLNQTHASAVDGLKNLEAAYAAGKISIEAYRIAKASLVKMSGDLAQKIDEEKKAVEAASKAEAEEALKAAQAKVDAELNATVDIAEALRRVQAAREANADAELNAAEKRKNMLLQTEAIERQTAQGSMDNYSKLEDQYNQHIEDIQSLREQDMANKDLYDRQILAMEQQKGEALTALAQQNAQAANSQWTSAFSSILSASQGTNEMLFRIAQAGGIATALVDTYTAATAALKLGPIAGPIAATAITAKGLANVAQIKAQKFEKRELGGTLNAGRPTLVGEKGPELILPSRSGSVIPNRQLQKMGNGGSASNNMNINVSFTVNAIDSRSFKDRIDEFGAHITNTVTSKLSESMMSF